ncbi:MAG: Hint domain-containing protein [Roseovarius sp.]|nr:Hint domain-containing protein [Roseovarius sp.]
MSDFSRPKTQASAVTCFTQGTAITTLAGKRPVETLRPGMRVLTRDRGFQPVIWSGRRCIEAQELAATPDLCPVLIHKGALGSGLPERDLLVSPGHRMLSTDPAHRAPTGETETLIEARALLGRPGITRARPAQLCYIHLAFDHHEIILSENTWSESFHIGPVTALALSSDHRSHLLATCPAPNGQPLARTCIPASA